MTKQIPPAAPASGGHQMPSADGTVAWVVQEICYRSGLISAAEEADDAMMAYLSIDAVQTDAVFVSGLQRCDEPSAGQVRQAVAAAVRAFGCSGCAGRVAQEFGDHPETAVIRMRWARGVAREAFADSPSEPGPGVDAGGLLVHGPRLPAEQASASPGAERREPARSAAGGEG